MKRIIQLTLLTALMLVLVLGTVPMVKSLLPEDMPNVGWNTGTSWEMPEAAPVARIVLPPLPMPNVGWNTGVSREAPEAAPLAFTIIVIRPNVGWNT